MEYVNEPEERVFEPSFGYGYIPDEDKPVLRKKNRRQAASDTKHTSFNPEDAFRENRLLGRKPSMPVVAFAVSVLIALLLLFCAVAASTGTGGHVSACETYMLRLPV